MEGLKILNEIMKFSLNKIFILNKESAKPKFLVFKFILLLLISGFVAFFYSSKIFQCLNGICNLDFSYIKYFPYPDFAENISGGMNAAKNLIFGSDYAHPHAPGIYIFLGILYKFFSISSLVQSPESAFLWTLFSIFGFSFLVLTIFSISFGFFFGSASYLILLVFMHNLNVAFIMSETVAFWLTIPMVYLALKYSSTSDYCPPYLLFILPQIILFCGVGFPSVIIFPLLVVIYNISIKQKIELKLFFYSLVPALLFFSFLVILLTNFTSLENLKFWVIDVNQTVGTQLFSNLKINIKHSWNTNFISEIFFLIFFQLIVLFYGLKKKYFDIYLFTILLAACIGCYWRVYFGYKAMPAASIIFGVILYIVKKENIFVKLFNDFKFSIFCLGFVSYLLALCFIGILKISQINKFENPDIALFDDPDICKLTNKSTSNCRCVEVLVFGPQIYIQNDIRQCQDQMNTWAGAMGENEKYLKTVLNDIDNKRAVYIVPPKVFYQSEERLSSLIDKIHRNYNCKYVKGEWQLCK